MTTGKTSEEGSPKRVGVLIDVLEEWRGTETHRFRLLACLDRRRIEPVVMVLGNAGLQGAFEERGVCILPLEIHRVFAMEGLKGLRTLQRIFIQERLDLAVCYHTASDLLGPLAGRWAGVPVISCRRDEGCTKKRFPKRCQRVINTLIQGMISVSGAVTRAVERDEGYPAARNEVIWNGENLTVFSPGESSLREELGIASAASVITCVGGLAAVKDHASLIAAFAVVRQTYPEAVLLLVGRGPEQAAIERQAAPLGDAVRLLGHRSDVARILRASDVYAQVSLTEGFSNAILQAMACGLPVVASAVGGNPELINDSSGILVKPRDVEAIARAICGLLADKTRRGAMAKAARARAEDQGSIAVMTERYTEAFLRFAK